MNNLRSNLRLGLVVPALENSGGVASVAGFISSIARSQKIPVKMISLAMDRRDPQSRLFLNPRRWFRPAESRTGTWRGMPMVHIGAEFVEFEFQRYRPRPLLNKVLDECNVIQVVCGTPAWANTVTGLNKPIALQVATRSKIERKGRSENRLTPLSVWRESMTVVTDLLDDIALRRVDAIQVENHWMFDYVSRLNANRLGVDIRYAPPGVNTCIFHPGDKRRLDSKSAYILSVGRFHDRRKNIMLLLEAFTYIQQEFRDLALITAGAGDPPPDYWRIVNRLGLQERVKHIHHPELSQLVHLYQGATVFTLSSDEEGLGVALLESMACGVPAVATRCGGPETVITDGKDGFLVPVGDALSLAEKLRSVCGCSELNEQMGTEARLTVESRFSETVTATAFFESWQGLLSS